jgi:hypothetical protein
MQMDQFSGWHEPFAEKIVHLGHLDNMMQEGYQPRTKNNRVRCVRVDPNNDK